MSEYYNGSRNRSLRRQQSSDEDNEDSNGPNSYNFASTNMQYVSDDNENIDNSRQYPVFETRQQQHQAQFVLTEQQKQQELNTDYNSAMGDDYSDSNDDDNKSIDSVANQGFQNLQIQQTNRAKNQHATRLDSSSYSGSSSSDDTRSRSQTRSRSRSRSHSGSSSKAGSNHASLESISSSGSESEPAATTPINRLRPRLLPENHTFMKKKLSQNSNSSESDSASDASTPRHRKRYSRHVSRRSRQQQQQQNNATHEFSTTAATANLNSLHMVNERQALERLHIAEPMKNVHPAGRLSGYSSISSAGGSGSDSDVNVGRVWHRSGRPPSYSDENIRLDLRVHSTKKSSSSDTSNSSDNEKILRPNSNSSSTHSGSPATHALPTLARSGSSSASVSDGGSTPRTRHLTPPNTAYRDVNFICDSPASVSSRNSQQEAQELTEHAQHMPNTDENLVNVQQNVKQTRYSDGSIDICSNRLMQQFSQNRCSEGANRVVASVMQQNTETEPVAANVAEMEQNDAENTRIFVDNAQYQQYVQQLQQVQELEQQIQQLQQTGQAIDPLLIECLQQQAEELQRTELMFHLQHEQQRLRNEDHQNSDDISNADLHAFSRDTSSNCSFSQLDLSPTEYERYMREVAEITRVPTKCRATKEDKVSLADFLIKRVLGCGAYGKVYLVQKKGGDDDKRLYAMKVLKKESVCLKTKTAEHTSTERLVLEAVGNNNPFLVSMHYAFQSESKLYMVLDYVPGGELFSYLYNSQHFSEDIVKIYIAEVIIALEHLHKLGIAYRDIKLENILLDHTGHIVITDYGLSKIFKPGGFDRTDSFCGTLEYMAPEILNKSPHGHDMSVDWWSVGVLTFELLAGASPFAVVHPAQANQADIARKIAVWDNSQIPNTFSEDARDFISKLLDKNPETRLGGSGRDATEIKRHNFFKGINWRDLRKKRRLSTHHSEVSEEEVDARTLRAGETDPEKSARIGAATQNFKLFRGFSYVAPDHLKNKDQRTDQFFQHHVEYCNPPMMNPPQWPTNLVVGEMHSSGAFGELFLVHEDSNPELKFIAKIIPEDKYRPSEVDALTSLNRMQNFTVCQYIKTFRHENEIRILMEYLPGAELALCIGNGLTELLCLELFSQIIDGVAHIHNNRFVHGDIKPENIVFSDIKMSCVKIVDFGNATYSSDEPFWYDVPRYTLDYAPPEVLQHADYAIYSFAFDIWCLGATLYRMFMGHPPFRKSRDDVDVSDDEMRARIRSGQFYKDEPRWLEASEALQNLIMRCLEVKMEDRITLLDMLRHPWIQQTDEDFEEQQVPEIPHTEHSQQTVSTELAPEPMQLENEPETVEKELASSTNVSAVHSRLSAELHALHTNDNKVHSNMLEEVASTDRIVHNIDLTNCDEYEPAIENYDRSNELVDKNAAERRESSDVLQKKKPRNSAFRKAAKASLRKFSKQYFNMSSDYDEALDESSENSEAGDTSRRSSVMSPIRFAESLSDSDEQISEQPENKIESEKNSNETTNCRAQLKQVEELQNENNYLAQKTSNNEHVMCLSPISDVEDESILYSSNNNVPAEQHNQQEKLPPNQCNFKQFSQVQQRPIEEIEKNTTVNVPNISLVSDDNMFLGFDEEEDAAETTTKKHFSQFSQEGQLAKKTDKHYATDQLLSIFSRENSLSEFIQLRPSSQATAPPLSRESGYFGSLPTTGKTDNLNANNSVISIETAQTQKSINSNDEHNMENLSMTVTSRNSCSSETLANDVECSTSKNFDDDSYTAFRKAAKASLRKCRKNYLNVSSDFYEAPNESSENSECESDVSPVRNSNKSPVNAFASVSKAVSSAREAESSTTKNSNVNEGIDKCGDKFASQIKYEKTNAYKAQQIEECILVSDSDSIPDAHSKYNNEPQVADSSENLTLSSEPTQDNSALQTEYEKSKTSDNTAKSSTLNFAEYEDISMPEQENLSMLPSYEEERSEPEAEESEGQQDSAVISTTIRKDIYMENQMMVYREVIEIHTNVPGNAGGMANLQRILQNQMPHFGSNMYRNDFRDNPYFYAERPTNSKQAQAPQEEEQDNSDDEEEFKMFDTNSDNIETIVIDDDSNDAIYKNKRNNARKNVRKFPNRNLNTVICISDDSDEEKPTIRHEQADAESPIKVETGTNTDATITGEDRINQPKVENLNDDLYQSQPQARYARRTSELARVSNRFNLIGKPEYANVKTEDTKPEMNYNARNFTRRNFINTKRFNKANGSRRRHRFVHSTPIIQNKVIEISDEEDEETERKYDQCTKIEHDEDEEKFTNMDAATQAPEHLNRNQFSSAEIFKNEFAEDNSSMFNDTSWRENSSILKEDVDDTIIAKQEQVEPETQNNVQVADLAAAQENICENNVGAVKEEEMHADEDAELENSNDSNINSLEEQINEDVGNLTEYNKQAEYINKESEVEEPSKQYRESQKSVKETWKEVDEMKSLNQTFYQDIADSDTEDMDDSEASMRITAMDEKASNDQQTMKISEKESEVSETNENNINEADEVEEFEKSLSNQLAKICNENQEQIEVEKQQQEDREMQQEIPQVSSQKQIEVEKQQQESQEDRDTHQEILQLPQVENVCEEDMNAEFEDEDEELSNDAFNEENIKQPYYEELSDIETEEVGVQQRVEKYDGEIDEEESFESARAEQSVIDEDEVEPLILESAEVNVSPTECDAHQSELDEQESSHNETNEIVVESVQSADKEAAEKMQPATEAKLDEISQFEVENAQEVAVLEKQLNYENDLDNASPEGVGFEQQSNPDNNVEDASPEVAELEQQTNFEIDLANASPEIAEFEPQSNYENDFEDVSLEGAESEQQSKHGNDLEDASTEVAELDRQSNHENDLEDASLEGTELKEQSNYEIGLEDALPEEVELEQQSNPDNDEEDASPEKLEQISNHENDLEDASPEGAEFEPQSNHENDLENVSLEGAELEQKLHHEIGLEDASAESTELKQQPDLEIGLEDASPEGAVLEKESNYENDTEDASLEHAELKQQTNFEFDLENASPEIAELEQPTNQENTASQDFELSQQSNEENASLESSHLEEQIQHENDLEDAANKQVEQNNQANVVAKIFPVFEDISDEEMMEDSVSENIDNIENEKAAIVNVSNNSEKNLHKNMVENVNNKQLPITLLLHENFHAVQKEIVVNSEESKETALMMEENLNEMVHENAQQEIVEPDQIETYESADLSNNNIEKVEQQTIYLEEQICSPLQDSHIIADKQPNVINSIDASLEDIAAACDLPNEDVCEKNVSETHEEDSDNSYQSVLCQRDNIKIDDLHNNDVQIKENSSKQQNTDKDALTEIKVSTVINETDAVETVKSIGDLEKNFGFAATCKIADLSNEDISIEADILHNIELERQEVLLQEKPGIATQQCEEQSAEELMIDEQANKEKVLTDNVEKLNEQEKDEIEEQMPVQKQAKHLNANERAKPIIQKIESLFRAETIDKLECKKATIKHDSKNVKEKESKDEESDEDEGVLVVINLMKKPKSATQETGELPQGESYCSTESDEILVLVKDKRSEVLRRLKESSMVAEIEEIDEEENENSNKAAKVSQNLNNVTVEDVIDDDEIVNEAVIVNKAKKVAEHIDMVTIEDVLNDDDEAEDTVVQDDESTSRTSAFERKERNNLHKSMTHAVLTRNIDSPASKVYTGDESISNITSDSISTITDESLDEVTKNYMRNNFDIGPSCQALSALHVQDDENHNKKAEIMKTKTTAETVITAETPVLSSQETQSNLPTVTNIVDFPNTHILLDYAATAAKTAIPTIAPLVYNQPVTDDIMTPYLVVPQRDQNGQIVAVVHTVPKPVVLPTVQTAPTIELLPMENQVVVKYDTISTDPATDITILPVPQVANEQQPSVVTVILKNSNETETRQETTPARNVLPSINTNSLSNGISFFDNMKMKQTNVNGLETKVDPQSITTTKMFKKSPINKRAEKDKGLLDFSAIARSTRFGESVQKRSLHNSPMSKRWNTFQRHWTHREEGIVQYSSDTDSQDENEHEAGISAKVSAEKVPFRRNMNSIFDYKNATTKLPFAASTPLNSAGKLQRETANTTSFDLKSKGLWPDAELESLKEKLRIEHQQMKLSRQQMKQQQIKLSKQLKELENLSRIKQQQKFSVQRNETISELQHSIMASLSNASSIEDLTRDRNRKTFVLQPPKVNADCIKPIEKSDFNKSRVSDLEEFERRIIAPLHEKCQDIMPPPDAGTSMFLTQSPNATPIAAAATKEATTPIAIKEIITIIPAATKDATTPIAAATKDATTPIVVSIKKGKTPIAAATKDATTTPIIASIQKLPTQFVSSMKQVKPTIATSVKDIRRPIGVGTPIITSIKDVTPLTNASKNVAISPFADRIKQNLLQRNVKTIERSSSVPPLKTNMCNNIIIEDDAKSTDSAKLMLREYRPAHNYRSVLTDVHEQGCYILNGKYIKPPLPPAVDCRTRWHQKHSCISKSRKFAMKQTQSHISLPANKNGAQAALINKMTTPPATKTLPTGINTTNEYYYPRPTEKHKKPNPVQIISLHIIDGEKVSKKDVLPNGQAIKDTTQTNAPPMEATTSAKPNQSQIEIDENTKESTDEFKSCEREEGPPFIREDSRLLMIVYLSGRRMLIDPQKILEADRLRGTKDLVLVADGKVLSIPEEKLTEILRQAQLLHKMNELSEKLSYMDKGKKENKVNRKELRRLELEKLRMEKLAVEMEKKREKDEQKRIEDERKKEERKKKELEKQERKRLREEKKLLMQQQKQEERERKAELRKEKQRQRAELKKVDGLAKKLARKARKEEETKRLQEELLEAEARRLELLKPREKPVVVLDYGETAEETYKTYEEIQAQQCDASINGACADVTLIEPAQPPTIDLLSACTSRASTPNTAQMTNKTTKITLANKLKLLENLSPNELGKQLEELYASDELVEVMYVKGSSSETEEDRKPNLQNLPPIKIPVELPCFVPYEANEPVHPKYRRYKSVNVRRRSADSINSNESGGAVDRFVGLKSYDISRLHCFTNIDARKINRNINLLKEAARHFNKEKLCLAELNKCTTNDYKSNLAETLAAMSNQVTSNEMSKNQTENILVSEKPQTIKQRRRINFQIIPNEPDKLDLASDLTLEEIAEHYCEMETTGKKLATELRKVERDQKEKMKQLKILGLRPITSKRRAKDKNVSDDGSLSASTSKRAGKKSQATAEAKANAAAKRKRKTSAATDKEPPKKASKTTNSTAPKKRGRKPKECKEPELPKAATEETAETAEKPIAAAKRKRQSTMPKSGEQQSDQSAENLDDSVVQSNAGKRRRTNEASARRQPRQRQKPRRFDE